MSERIKKYEYTDLDGTQFDLYGVTEEMEATITSTESRVTALENEKTTASTTGSPVTLLTIKIGTAEFI